MNPISRNSQTLRPERSFVVQFVDDPNSHPYRRAGRIEHVVSGRSAHFASVAELLTIIDRILGDQTLDDRS
jgi:hypothetical protein